MNTSDQINTDTITDIVPKSDATGQAVNSLRGYVYQALATALAWLDIDDNDRIFLEVAEDYAVMAEQALSAVQVKDTEGSGSVTLNSESVRKAIAAYVDLVQLNPSSQVYLRFFTTSEIGTERTVADRPAGEPGLEYWRKVATGADVSPLRKILESDKFPESVSKFSKDRDDVALRSDLIGRISWDCGMPDFSKLRQKLEDRLIVLVRDKFNLSALEVPRLTAQLIYLVLNKSIVNQIENRVLTRAELYKVIDEATQISVPRGTYDVLFKFFTNFARSLPGSKGNDVPLTTVETDWFVESTTLPAPQGMITRNAIESEIANALEEFGAGVLVGSSGVGKSIVSRAVAGQRASVFFMADCRNTDSKETRRRLNMVFGLTGGLPASMLILEDLHYIEDTHVALSLARVIQASRQHGHEVLITCYRTPSSKTLAEIGLNQGCLVTCPYFSEEETHALVLQNGGNSSQWGRVAYVAGAAGHPQLTHAFITGIAVRGWSSDEMGDFLVARPIIY